MKNDIHVKQSWYLLIFARRRKFNCTNETNETNETNTHIKDLKTVVDGNHNI